MVGDGAGRVAVNRRIDAPPHRVFAVLTDPARHPSFDGSGMVCDGAGNEPVTAVGDVFWMRMRNDEMGEYEMANHVVDFERDRRVVWEPVMSKASRREDEADIGARAAHRWGYQLVPEGDVTSVTEIFDCSQAPEWLQRAVRGGERWRADMTASLELLDQQCGSNNGTAVTA